MLSSLTPLFTMPMQRHRTLGLEDGMLVFKRDTKVWGNYMPIHLTSVVVESKREYDQRQN